MTGWVTADEAIAHLKIEALEDEIARLRGAASEPRPEPPPPPTATPPQLVERNKVSHRRVGGEIAESPLADEILDASVKLVQALGRFIYTSDESLAEPLLAAEARIKQHFPGLRRREVVKLARVLVHVGSISLRHALGMVVVLPEHNEPIPVPIHKRGLDRRFKAQVWTDSAMTQAIPLEQALDELFDIKAKMTTADISQAMADRGWTVATQAHSRSGYVRDYMDKSPLFFRSKLRSSGQGKAIIWRRRRKH